MIIALSLRWWYSAGFRWVWQRALLQRIQACFEFFSTPVLIKTWLAPFKQTTSGGKRSSIDAKIQASIDNLVSRMIGALARTVLIISAFICVCIVIVTGLIGIVLWPFIPVMPIIAISLAMGSL